MSADRYGPVPIYREIANELRAEIERGDHPAHSRFTTEKTVMERFGVARATARQAIGVLREEGWVYTIGQRGTFVAPRE